MTALKAPRLVRVRLVAVEMEVTLEGAPQITSPSDAAAIALAVLPTDREGVAVIHLDTRSRVRSAELASIGMLDAAMMHPREVFKAAILANAARIIVAHNHPSGDPEPSDADYDMTERLVKAGEILGIEVLDSLVVAGRKVVSIRERGAR